jgi:hypothetical protein
LVVRRDSGIYSDKMHTLSSWNEEPDTEKDFGSGKTSVTTVRPSAPAEGIWSVKRAIQVAPVGNALIVGEGGPTQRRALLRGSHGLEMREEHHEEMRSAQRAM